MTSHNKKRFVHPERDQLLLLPPVLDEWVTKDHFARFLVDVLEQLDFSKFYSSYKGDGEAIQGRPPYAPELMVGLLFYSVSKGALSSRSIEELAYTDVGARFLTGNHQPDHACIVRFRVRHREALGEIFSQVVLLCHRAGLVSLKHVSLDSTPCRANVAPNSSIKIENLNQSWEKSKAKSKAILEKMEAADEEDKAQRKKLERQLKEADGRSNRLKETIDFLRASGRCPDDSQAENADQTTGPEDDTVATSWAEHNRTARKAIGRTIKEKRIQLGHNNARDFAKKLGIDPRTLSAVEVGRSAPNEELRKLLSETLSLSLSDLEIPPFPKAVREKLEERLNITDRDSYITYKPSKGYLNSYLGQVAADSTYQIVIDAEISKRNSDHSYVPAFTDRCQERFQRQPEALSTDTGYCCGDNIRHAAGLHIDLHCSVPSRAGKSAKSDPDIVRMREKLETKEGKEVYNLRSAIVEPIFSRLASRLRFHRLLHRGYEKVNAEWLQMLTGYNLTRWFAAVVAARKS